MATCPSCAHENADGARFCSACGAELAPAAPAREQRKIVTVLFCDLVGSTALGETLDPERLRALLARYFERMKGIVERHGGSVEKFIGDAVMAVFGVPVVHEDDALRAVRAAVEMRDALPELGLEGRIGVTTGEVVTGTEERLATGDAVNVAARLEQAAQPGEVLVGEANARARSRGGRGRAGRAARAQRQGRAGSGLPAAARARCARAPARGPVRRTRARARAPPRRFARVRAEQRCELVTLVGDAGVGKSRLAAEALASTEATLVRGRCLPYGEGITYWPVVEVLEAARPAAPRTRPPQHRSARCSARRRRRRPPRRSPGPSARRLSRRRRSGRWESSSTTSSGARRRFSTCSSMSPSSPRAHRSCSSASRGRSCATAAPPGR